MYEKMNDEARNSYLGKILKQEIDKLAALQPGKDAPNFHLTAIDGREISLKDCAGSYVLIYHWGLCPGSLWIDNEVIDLHNKYKDRLKIIGITDNIETIKSLYDKAEPGHKLMGIELRPVLENMLAHPWFDAEKTGNNGKIEQDYAFGGLPYFVFISPDGKIIARGFQDAFYTAKETMEKEFGN
jgi:cytochrome oxidase Cu insertion factor (SCO1/SenC/PrrC family)